ncbi:mannose-1-phosphate guanylyltransferase/mannose-6-phosphate isomerase [Vibrio sp. SS-MA-C1-2]|uniref:mannose-1-phosphate guanylyltransferase/mannose-6-phosphate isomerase n=1 Tax=Vibrio sp. SS-MA-C1-2 TaxID=2908646 RepID=UPI001F21AB53|nr:mannose-1-phosphate guanylyltransferase/mannose-6-phosphate isomerase [Vibrio sp. SS-MA-C1-2]UJF17838.1 mannose-1-phosphate guanylyltransferase/mannose-6-phosphate isomerase [Vibrio sp. SS-MA-C1-2]
MILPVVIAGGASARLWPLSHSHYPKQFLPLLNDTTMIQDTLQRLDGLDLFSPYVVCHHQHRFIVAEQLTDFSPDAIILEPIGRNTAPAIALAAFHAIALGGDPLMLVLPADHKINHIAAFHQAVEQSIDAAENGFLVTFGVIPNRAETGYGYIKQGAKYSGQIVFVDKFVEKPNAEDAATYVNGGHYCWNSGIFLFKASTYLDELNRYQPEIFNACHEALESGVVDPDFVRINEHSFTGCPDISIDYAVLEKSDKVLMTPMDVGWSDIGSWQSLWQESTRDENQNVLNGNVAMIDSQNNYIHSTGRLIATLGINDLVIVDSDDAILIADKHRSQDVKLLVEKIKKIRDFSILIMNINLLGYRRV